MEGAEPFQHSIELIEIFARLGLNMTTLTHSRRNALADGTQQDSKTGGLTALEAVVQRCQKSASSSTWPTSLIGFWDIIELADGPLLLSHTSVLTPSPGYRLPWNEINPTYGMTKAEAIAKTGGLVGVVFWSMADTAALVAECDALLEQIGAEHIGLGTDFFGFEHAPSDLQHIGELPALTEALVKRGYDDPTIEGSWAATTCAFSSRFGSNQRAPTLLWVASASARRGPRAVRRASPLPPPAAATMLSCVTSSQRPPKPMVPAGSVTTRKMRPAFNNPKAPRASRSL